MNIRQNDIVELGPDCRETHVPLGCLPGGVGLGLRAGGFGFEYGHYRIERQRTQMHHLVFTVAGEGWFEVDGERLVARPGWFWCCPVGGRERYGLGKGKRWEILWVNLCADAGPWTALLAGRRSGLWRSHWVGQLQRILQALHRESFGEDFEKQRLQALNVEAMGLYLQRELSQADVEAAGGDQRKASLRAVFDIVREDLAWPWTVEELLRRSDFYVSVDHFSRLCREALGRTPMQMVTFLRLQHCAVLLRNTDYSLEAIAPLVGYRSPFALSNAFTREFGQRPREFRGA